VKYTNPLYYLLAFLFLAVSCKSIKTPDGVVIKKRSPSFLLKRLNQNKLDAEWLSAKAKVNVKMPGENIPSSTATIRMRKDSVIWMVIKKIGVTAAQVQINQDSVYIIDRLNRQYAIKGFDFIDKQFNLSALSGGQKVDFSLLQNFLLGNPQFFAFESVNSEIKDYQYRINGGYQDLESEYYIDPSNYWLNEMGFNDTKNNRDFKVVLSKYQPLKNKKDFSYIRNLNLSSEETGEVSIKLRFTYVEINKPQTIRFSIPSHYKRVE